MLKFLKTVFLFSCPYILVLGIAGSFYYDNVVHQNLGEQYIGDRGMGIAGNGAEIIAKAGSTVVLYKNAHLTEGFFSRLSTKVDFALNFDDHFAMTRGPGIIPRFWDSRTIAEAGSLVMAGGNAFVLAEEGATIIRKDVEAPDWLWDLDIGLSAVYERARQEAN